MFKMQYFVKNKVTNCWMMLNQFDQIQWVKSKSQASTVTIDDGVSFNETRQVIQKLLTNNDSTNVDNDLEFCEK